MKGDFSRDTFDRTKQFSRVLMQQGRVQLDADFNEQVSILLHYLRTLATDLGGPHWGPQGALGFEIVTKDSFKSLNTGAITTKWKNIEPDSALRKTLQDAVEQGDVVIGRGRYYVDGVLVENHRAMLYTEQPGYAEFEQRMKLVPLREINSPILFYLDAWERHVTCIEQELVREVALGGPDTCSRAQVVWQVQVLLSGEGESLACDAVEALPGLGTGKLRARARLDHKSADPCAIAPDSRYRGAENQLYRVEVHKAGKATGLQGSATFKWSRDNGCGTYPVRSLSGTTVRLEHLGRDSHLTLNHGDWVEVVDESIAMSGHAGPLAQVETIQRDELTVTLKLPKDLLHLPEYSEEDMGTRHALLRRWDHAGDSARFGGALAIAGQEDTEAGKKNGWVELEDGVQIWLWGDGDYRVGDYWLIPARVATGDVQWPDELDASGNLITDAEGNSIGAACEAHGPRHHYAPLFLYDPDAPDDLQDCRCLIAPIPCKKHRK